jgi:hypothetical protein
MMGAGHMAESLVKGVAEGPLLYSDTGISFWGGIDPVTGTVIDRGHPLHGKSVAGKVLVIPAGRGSCTGSAVLLQLLMNDVAPAAILFSTREEILTLGVIVAEEMFGRSIPLAVLAPEDHARLATASHASIGETSLLVTGGDPEDRLEFAFAAVPRPPVALADDDRAFLTGEREMAGKVAMRIIIRMADILDAEELIDVRSVHIDGCIYTGAASLEFARKLVALGGRVSVPTTLNAISVDQRNWRNHGTDPVLSQAASDLADAYLALGCRMSFTCAPYLRDDAPNTGTDIAWAESNAVVFANSVLGARTMKYPDFLDALIALTGRAPKAGCHLDRNRKATVIIDVADCGSVDDSFWPLLGYHVGMLTPTGIPVVDGPLDRWRASVSELRPDGQTQQSWLWAAPAKHSTRQISEVLERIDLLYTLDVHKHLAGPCQLNAVLAK